MHYWGDDWFENNGNDLYAAINFIEDYLRKHHIGICGKEKYGSFRDEYLRFWDGGIYEILFGYSCFIGTYRHYKNEKLKKAAAAIDEYIKSSFALSILKDTINLWGEIPTFSVNK